MTRITLLFFTFLSPIASIANEKIELLKTCDMVEAKLKASKYTKLSHNLEKFKDEYDDIYYTGCVLNVAGIIASEPNYYKNLMSLYPGQDKHLGQQGWKADRQSDGPDGVSFTIIKKKVFCQVTGDWPGEFFNYRVECGVKE